MAPSTLPSDRPTKRLACRQCQRRKIKCDRCYPCMQCDESGLTCEQSSRKKRAKPRVGIKREDDLRNRLANLESLVHRLNGDDSPPHAPDDVLPSADKYLASHFWSSLATEVHALREALESDEEGSEQENESGAGSSPSLVQDGTNGVSENFEFIFCSPGNILVLPDAMYEPEKAMADDLVDIYIDRVDRPWKKFHTPTLLAFTRDGQPYLGRSAQAPCNQALKAVIYFAAVGQMTDDECEQRYHEKTPALLDRFRRLAEMKLIQADPLNTTAFATLQALVQYVAALRKVDPSRRSWALYALTVRVARAFKLHRESGNEPVFMRELRRRLWHNLIVMDSFFTLDRGSESMISLNSFSRPLPTSLNDADFNENSKPNEMVPRETEFTEMSFPLAISELAACVNRINFLEDKPVGEDWKQRLKVAESMRRTLSEKYLQYCDWNIDFQRHLLRIAEAVLSGLTLRAVRPMQRDPSSTLPPIDSPWVFDLALNVLRKSCEIGNDLPLRKWKNLRWVQWHPIAVVLAGLCTIKDMDPKTEEEAFYLAEKMMAYSEHSVADGSAGSLWKPVERLYKKAAARRDTRTQTISEVRARPTNGEVPTTNLAAIDLSEQISPSQRMWDYVSHPANFDLPELPASEDIDWLNWNAIIANMDVDEPTDPTSLWI